MYNIYTILACDDGQRYEWKKMGEGFGSCTLALGIGFPEEHSILIYVNSELFTKFLFWQKVKNASCSEEEPSQENQLVLPNSLCVWLSVSHVA